MDVLGWRGIYQRKPNPLSDLEELVSGLRDLHRPDSPIETQIKSISDTIAVFSRGEEDEWPRLIEWHGQLAALAITRGINYELPIRGATSVGEFQLLDDMFVGPALDEAAGWYEKADWIGVHLTPSAAFSFKPGLGSMWVEYKPPLTGAGGWRCPCVLWPFAWDFEEGDRASLQRVFRNLGPITPDISNKYTNALRFFDDMQGEIGRVNDA